MQKCSLLLNPFLCLHSIGSGQFPGRGYLNCTRNISSNAGLVSPVFLSWSLLCCSHCAFALHGCILDGRALLYIWHHLMSLECTANWNQTYASWNWKMLIFLGLQVTVIDLIQRRVSCRTWETSGSLLWQVPWADIDSGIPLKATICWLMGAKWASDFLEVPTKVSAGDILISR